MSLEKVEVITQIEINEIGCINIRKSTRVLEDGKQIGEDSHHRSVLMPGDKIEEYPEIIKSLSKAVWTEECLKNYEKIKERTEKQTPGSAEKQTPESKG